MVEVGGTRPYLSNAKLRVSNGVSPCRHVQPPTSSGLTRDVVLGLVETTEAARWLIINQLFAYILCISNYYRDSSPIQSQQTTTTHQHDTELLQQGNLAACSNLLPLPSTQGMER